MTATFRCRGCGKEIVENIFPEEPECDCGGSMKQVIGTEEGEESVGQRHDRLEMDMGDDW